MADAATDPKRGSGAAGSEAVSSRRVLSIALPIVLSNATVPLLGLVDTFAVGQAGAAQPIGAVAVGAVVLSTLYWAFGFLRMGTTGFVAQAYGAGDRAEMSAILSRALLIAAGAGLAFILLQIPVIAAALFITAASAEVEALAATYLSIRIWGAPAAIALYAFQGWLIGMQRTRGILILQLAMNLTNIALSLWFVLVLDLGVAGVALATLIAEWGGAALALWLCREAFLGRDWRDRARILDPARVRRMLSVNADIMIRSVLLTLAFLSVVLVGASLGDVPLAANQILLQFVSLTATALDGFAFAAEALVGAAFGSGDRARVRRAAVLASLWGLVMAAAIAMAFALGGSWLIGEMTTALDVQAEARRYLFWVVIAALLGYPAFMLDGIFIGATRSRDLRNMMILSFAIYLPVLALLVPLAGNHGLWAALMILYVMRAVTLLWRYPALEVAVGARA